MILQAIWNPAWYHGHHKKHSFFEGWYFKFVNAAGDRRYAVIPGIFLHKTAAESHCFIQVLDGMTGKSTYHRFPAAEFHTTRDEFDLQIEKNRFRVDSLTLHLDSAELSLHGELNFQGLQPWPVKTFSPGVMGWYTFAPFMECYHGVLSLYHHVTGTLTINGEAVTFDGGVGYIEKDWGKAFPSGYIWMQTNHFEVPEVCLTASVAMIPWLGSSFRGHIVGFWHEGELYRFATYTGAKSKGLTLTDTHVHWELVGRTGTRKKRSLYRLELDAERASGGLLKAPYRIGMLERVVESLTATVDVRLIDITKGERLVFAGSGRYAGLEVAGDLSRLLDEDRTSKVG